MPRLLTNHPAANPLPKESLSLEKEVPGADPWEGRWQTGQMPCPVITDRHSHCKRCVCKARR